MAAASRWPAALRAAHAAAGVFAPLPVLAFLIGDVAIAGPPFVAVVAALHAAPGLGWISIGIALGAADRVVEAEEEPMPPLVT
ncbi:MAG: hypothetical protein ACT4OQ_05030 [Chloroflexota bacterium]